MSDYLNLDSKLLWALGIGAVVAGVVMYVFSEVSWILVNKAKGLVKHSDFDALSATTD